MSHVNENRMPAPPAHPPSLAGRHSHIRFTEYNIRHHVRIYHQLEGRQGGRTRHGEVKVRAAGFIRQYTGMAGYGRNTSNGHGCNVSAIRGHNTVMSSSQEPTSRHATVTNTGIVVRNGHVITGHYYVTQYQYRLSSFGSHDQCYQPPPRQCW